MNLVTSRVINAASVSVFDDILSLAYAFTIQGEAYRDGLPTYTVTVDKIWNKKGQTRKERSKSAFRSDNDGNNIKQEWLFVAIPTNLSL